jgi:hypothetical protein
MATDHPTSYARLGKSLEGAKDKRTDINQRGSKNPILKKYRF